MAWGIWPRVKTRRLLIPTILEERSAARSAVVRICRSVILPKFRPRLKLIVPLEIAIQATHRTGSSLRFPGMRGLSCFDSATFQARNLGERRHRVWGCRKFFGPKGNPLNVSPSDAVERSRRNSIHREGVEAR